MNRREFLHGSAGLVLAARSMSAKASQPATAVNFAVPAGACDCHTHVFGDPAKYPLFSGRTYTPETATAEEMNAMHRKLGLQRVVIVTPSVYGTDNTSTLDGIKSRGADARGIAVINEQTPDRELEAMNQGGIRGIRFNLSTGGSNDPAAAVQRFTAAMDRMKRHGWHIQTFTNLRVISGLKDTVMNSAVPVVFDHFGGARAAAGLEQPGFADLVALVKSGKAYVKISGADSASTLEPDFPDATPLARALIAANPDRVLWGTNWPHPGTGGSDRLAVTPLRQIDDGHMLNLLAVWAPDAAVRKKILVDNPARLFGF
jgi:predicted TIM-barrel fold metal-dependent hydrolase